ncbi:MAG: insulinase family protein [bacterium]|nr:insulinase family protein [bacterium]
MKPRYRSLPATFPVILLILTMSLLMGGLPSLHAKKTKKRPVDKLTFPAINQFQLPAYQKAKTANGIKLRLIKDDKLPLVTLRVLFRGGSAYEPLSKVGLSGITAEMLRIGGAKGIKPDELDKQLDANGISLGSRATIDYFTVTLTCLEENLDRSLSLMAKVLREPSFDDEKLEEIKTRMSSGISRRNDQPNGILGREFDKLIYGADSPFASVMEHEHIDNISRLDVMRTYRDFYAADNMLVGAVGPLEMDNFKKLFEKHFGSWNTKANLRPFPTATEQKHDFKVAFAVKNDLNQNYINVGHMGVKRDLKMEAKFMVFNSIFSQGASSRLYLRIRTKMGLSYGARGGVQPEEIYPGTTSFYTFTKSESTVPVLKAIFDEIDIIRKGKVTQKELKTAKDYFLNSFVFRYSTPGQILYNSLQKELYGIPEDADKKLLEDIKNVTADDVLEVAQKYLAPEKMVVCLVGNEKKIEGNLSDIGKVKKIDLTIKPPALKEKIPPATPESLAKGQQLIDSLAAGKYKGYTALKSLETTSDVSMSMQGRKIAMVIKSTQLFPGKNHVEVSVMGMKFYTIFDGKKGMSIQMGKKTVMPEEDVEKSTFGNIYDLFTSKDKHKVQYLKEEKIDGKTYDVLYIFDAKKNWKKLFVNRDSGLMEIEEEVAKLPGQSGVARKIKSDFKTVKGIPVSFSSKTFVKDKVVMEVKVKDVKVNPTVDPSIFKTDPGK